MQTMIKTENCVAEVLNWEDREEKYKYVVARVCGNELWFFGAYETESRAREVAYELGELAVVLTRN